MAIVKLENGTVFGSKPARTPLHFMLPFALLAFAIGAPTPASGKDVLGDFEDAVDDAKKSDDDDYDFDDFDLDSLLGIPELIGDAAMATVDHFYARRPGDPAAPVLKLEGTYQALNTGDVDGYTVRGELGWAFLGVGGEFIGYREDTPNQTLELTSIEGLLRFAPHPALRMSLAFGTRGLDGNNDSFAVQAGVSAGIYPNPWLGVEVDLRWADLGGDGEAFDGTLLADYRIGGLLRHPDFPFAALRGGYRTIQVGDEALHGGEIGLVFTW